uniref:MADF domain-containing protein n=1 Tax=Cacopsylla melanoneura TaxID=428564 RepID=A0A8D8PYU2_9HEMI
MWNMIEEKPEIRKLIEEVRKQPVLYSTEHAEYKNHQLKARVWEKIADRLHIDNGKEARRQWMNLRGNFRDAKRRQVKALSKGTPTSKIRPWRYQKQMAFLEPFTSTGNEDENRLSKAVSITDDSDVQLDEDSSEYGNASYIEITPDDILDDSADDMGGVVAKKLKRSKNAYHSTEGSESEESVTDSRMTSVYDSDPLFHFFMAMYQSTKKLPPQLQHQIKRQVFQAVSDAEAGILP